MLLLVQRVISCCCSHCVSEGGYGICVGVFGKAIYYFLLHQSSHGVKERCCFTSIASLLPCILNTHTGYAAIENVKTIDERR